MDQENRNTSLLLPDLETIDFEEVITLIPGFDPFENPGDSEFYPGEARNVVGFFHDCLTHAKGRLAGTPLILEPWQMAIMANLFGWIRSDGTRRFRELFCYVSRKNGKDLYQGTALPTPSGWTTMGELSEGDRVFDECGNPCRVVHATEIRTPPETYLVRFSNGEEVKACSEHQWITSARVAKPGDKSSGRTKRPLTCVRTTREIFETQNFGSRGDRNHRLYMPEPLMLPTAKLAIDPYVLGCWLGDGTSAGASFCCHNLETKHFESEFANAGCELHRRKTEAIPTYSIRATVPGFFGRVAVGSRDPGNFLESLRAFGLLNNKHIPPVYLRASFPQRLALLQGLMDTEGTADNRGRACEFVTVLPALRDGVCELLATLGIKYRCREKQAALEGRIIGPSYRIQFFVSPDVMPVFRMKRKLDRIPKSGDRKTAQRSRTVTIMSVEPCDPVPMRCIAVDSPSNLYLFGRTMLPTHNTTISAGIPLYVLFTDPEIGMEIYAAAADKLQAGILFGIAKRMVLSEPHLDSRCRVYMNELRIEKTNSFLKPISKDSRTKHGFNASCVVVDELHAQADRDLVDVLETSTGSREQPIFASITTADFDRPIEESICNEKLLYAQQVRDGVINDPSFLPVIYETLISEDWKDPAVHRKANPNLGVSVMADYFERKFKKALQSRAFENTFKRLHLNQKTQQDVRYLAEEDWESCRTKIDLEKLKGKPCYAGLDLASSDDITAMVLIFPTVGFTCLPFFWVPKRSAQMRSKLKRVKYLEWASQGFIELTEGDRFDDEYVLKRIYELRKKYRIREFGIDPWEARHVVNQLDRRGIRVNEFAQGYASMNAPTRLLEALIHAGRLKHDGNPVMSWMAGNLAVQEDPTGHIRPAKKLSTEKIDGMVALIMAIATASLHYNRQSSFTSKGFDSV